MSAKPSLSDIAAFAESCFDKSGYAATFPLVFAHGNHENLHTIFHDNQLVALAASRLLVWHRGNRLVRGLCIGSVCSDKTRRGHGFGLAALERAEAHAARLSADFIFLFSDMQAYYERAGYQSIGTELFVPFSNLTTDDADAHRNRARLSSLAHTATESTFALISGEEVGAKPELCQAIWRLFATHASSAESTLSYRDLALSLAIPRLQFLVLTTNGQLTAAAMFGKGADFENIVHGLCFVGESYGHLLLDRACQSIPGGFTLMVPPGAEECFNHFFQFTAPLLFAKWPPTSSLRRDELVELLDQRRLYPRSLQSI
jgi:hypothetical protein